MVLDVTASSSYVSSLFLLEKAIANFAFRLRWYRCDSLVKLRWKTLVLSLDLEHYLRKPSFHEASRKAHTFPSSFCILLTSHLFICFVSVPLFS